MGQKRDAKALFPSRHRLSKRRGWIKRRQMLKALAGEESTRISTGDECVNCQDSVKLLTDLTDSNTSTEDTQCLKPVPVSQGAAAVAEDRRWIITRELRQDSDSP
ncbi:uncharacterized protein LOC118646071 isoform X2 [Monomorium pharaonis]|uniref:uncharacterized protein LOC118646071 isoform X2 n=1 Tax=Monomorium pharaonis TaxID=307658 RepID=UPI0017468756|nr:uncharacterized protein LOC118646071 isoform X2 [Monomorium pharaonis]